jgi:predicted nucleic acid-binding protein
MTFLDTGILVAAVLKAHPEHTTCLEALEDSLQPFTNAHALAEMFATLTGF